MKPGTVVDTTVTKPEKQDFFMVSQSCNQGTVAPVHYDVIWNDCEWPLQTQQKLAYKLTHLYFNWQGTIKVPAPCQYAHKLAYIVGENIKAAARDNLETKLWYL